MKKLIIIAILFCTPLTILAQSEQAEFKGGVGYSTLVGGDANNLKSTFSWKAGFGFDYHIVGDFYIQPSLFVVSKGFKNKGYIDPADTANYRGDLHGFYVQIPVYLAFRYAFTDNIKFVIDGGPYIAYGISGSKRFFEKKKVGGYICAQRLDVGLGAEAKLEIDNIVIGADVTRGLTHVFQNTKTYNLTYGLIVGIQF